MKRILISLFVLLIGCFSVKGFSQDSAVTKVGEWGSGPYSDVSVQGNYAYCTAGSAGLDILDISNPANPQKVNSYDDAGSLDDIHIAGNYAYVVNPDGGFQVLDIANPSSPTLAGSYTTSVGDMSGIYVYGNYVYLLVGKTNEDYSEHTYQMQIIDISTPSSPTLVGIHETNEWPRDVVVSGNYAYVATGIWDVEIDQIRGGFEIVDISNPASPFPAAPIISGGEFTSVDLKGNYAYVGAMEGGILVIDVSNPSSPTITKRITDPWFIDDIYISGNYAYVAADRFVIYDINDPANPQETINNNFSGSGSSIFVSGNYAYVLGSGKGLEIIDVSNPSAPSAAGEFEAWLELKAVHVNGNYAYLADFHRHLKIIDISNPLSPVLAAKYNTSWSPRDIYIKDNYVYVVETFDLSIFDVSNPTVPSPVGTYDSSFLEAVYVNANYAYLLDNQKGLLILDVSTPSSPSLSAQLESIDSRSIYVTGNYAYVADYNSGLYIIDVSNPSSPEIVGNYNTSGAASYVHAQGDYAYVVTKAELQIIDVSNPSSPSPVGSFPAAGIPRGIYIQGNYAYVVYKDTGLKIINVSDPASPFLAASYDTPGIFTGIYVRNDHVYITKSNKFLILRFEPSAALPNITVNRSQLIFASDSSGTATPPQSFFISNSGGSTLNWSASSNKNWLNCSPTSGTGSGEVTVSVDSTGLSPGTYNGTITISDPHAANSPQTVTVTLNVYSSGQTSFPFGDFATPIHGSTVRSSVPFTGWVLDDIGVQCVQIFREANGSLVYIGDAVFVEGARPDVEQVYPGYPLNYKAGWGYMMLTNFLPNGGNGTFNIHALATDTEGNQVTLGVKTIICDNANAVKPFGAMDTPTQGGTASGSQFINWGWVLTPQPNSIPTDGSTINVWVDGVNIGHPTYNNYRADIAGLFPGYANSDGAVGYFYLDTTAYENGVHTIQWTAADDAGNTDGIGSRYFTIGNTGESRVQGVGHSADKEQARLFRGSIRDIPVDHSRPIHVKKGYGNRETQIKYPDENGTFAIGIKELERLEIHLFDEEEPTLNVEHRTLKISSLPIGSTLDARRGVFCWQPGVGFVGEYRFVFIATDHAGNQTRKNIVVNIISRFSKGDDTPNPKRPVREEKRQI